MNHVLIALIVLGLVAPTLSFCITARGGEADGEPSDSNERRRRPRS